MLSEHLIDSLFQHRKNKRSNSTNVLKDKIPSLSLCISFSQALCGCTVNAPTLDGRTIPMPMQDVVVRPGMKRRVTGEGLPLPKHPERRGDLVVEFEVKFPERLSQSARDTIAQVLPAS